MSTALAPALDAFVVAAAASFILVFVLTAAARVSIQAPLTEMDLGTIQAVRRVLDHQQLYPAPTATFVAAPYPPLYYYASAAVAVLTGADGFVPLRLTSIVSTLATFVLIAVWVRRETGSWQAGVVAAGLYAATYRMTDAWFDVERVDALCLALLVAGLYTLRISKGPSGTVAAGVLVTLSALTKQGSWIVALPIAGVLAIDAPHRSLIFALTVVAGAVASTGLLTVIDGPWYSHFVFGIAAHPIIVFGQLNSWAGVTYDVVVREVAAVLPVALLVSLALLIEPVCAHTVLSAPAARLLCAAWLGTFGAGLASYLAHHSRPNVLMPVYACTAIGFGIAAHELGRLVREASLARTWCLLSAACLVQFVSLVYVPWHLLQPMAGATNEDVLVIGDNARVTHRTLTWLEAERVPHTAVLAVAGLIVFAPPSESRDFGTRVARAICDATDERPFVVNPLLYNGDWQDTLAAQTGRPLPLAPSIDAARAACHPAVVQTRP